MLVSLRAEDANHDVCELQLRSCPVDQEADNGTSFGQDVADAAIVPGCSEVMYAPY